MRVIILSQVGVPAGVTYEQSVTEHCRGTGATIVRRIKLKIVFKIVFVITFILLEVTSKREHRLDLCRHSLQKR